MALGLCSRVYSFGVAVHNFFYDKGIKKTTRPPCPVISIGNITVGGTGKTPLVIRTASYLQAKGLKTAILSRGYKAGKGKITDEPAILAKGCPKCAIIVDSDRRRGAKKAVEEETVNVIVLDDGFQHRRLSRDLDIICIDATCPFGYEKMLPAGLLREPVSSIARANVAVITRSDQVDEGCIAAIKSNLKRFNPEIIIEKAVHKITSARMIRGRSMPLEELKEKKAAAFCGIGNPHAFFRTAESIGCELVLKRIFNDHYKYKPADAEKMYEDAKKSECDIILTTQKDWVKTALLFEQASDIPLAYLEVELDFPAGSDKIKLAIDDILNKRLNPDKDEKNV